MAPTKVLLVGAGSRGQTVYSRFCLEFPEIAKVVAVAEPLPTRRQRIASEHQLEDSKCFASWRELSEQPGLADVAIVATDDRDHRGPAELLLDQGYHLLLEKPMAPSLRDCESILASANKASGMSAVCHVLRYTEYFLKLRSLIAGGAVGEVVSIRHFEPVNYWHFAHSFVRGNWRNLNSSSPFILAKCCHDMDILLFLSGETPTHIQSFGGLYHFQPEKAPAQASERCLDCELSESCSYSATRFYGGMLARREHWWPLDVVTREFTPQALERALREGNYGRCVYRCDNDVCDHQTVNVRFASGATASLVATAFTECPARETDVMGSEGMLRGNGTEIVHHSFGTGHEERYQVESRGNHLGGDEAMLREFFSAVRQNDSSLLSSSIPISMMSHRMALLAEQSRIENRVLEI